MYARISNMSFSYHNSIRICFLIMLCFHSKHALDEDNERLKRLTERDDEENTTATSTTRANTASTSEKPPRNKDPQDTKTMPAAAWSLDWDRWATLAILSLVALLLAIMLGKRALQRARTNNVMTTVPAPADSSRVTSSGTIVSDPTNGGAYNHLVLRIQELEFLVRTERGRTLGRNSMSHLPSTYVDRPALHHSAASTLNSVQGSPRGSPPPPPPLQENIEMNSLLF